MNNNEIKKYITEQVFLEDNSIKEVVSSNLTLKPNVSIFDNLKLSNMVIKTNTYFYLFNRNEIRVKITNASKFNEIKNLLISNSSKLGGFSVKELRDNEPELSLEWPPITQEKKNKVQLNIKQSEVILLNKLREKRQKCKNVILSNATKEEKRYIEKILEETFTKEKNKITLHVQKIIKNI